MTIQGWRLRLPGRTGRPPGRTALPPGRTVRMPWRAVRMPRRTVRLRLTLLYGGLFLLSGTGLLIITYILVAHRFPTLVTAHGTTAIQGQGGAGVPVGGSAATSVSGPACASGQLPVTAEQFSRCAAQAKAAAARQQATMLNQLLTQSGVALAIMTVISIGLGWLVAGRVLRPLRTITTAARRLSASSLHERLALTGPDDELKELGDTFDGLLTRLEAAFGAQRQFVANASHELRTPLARQRTLVEVALADPQRTVGSLSEACARVLAAGEQQERLIEALLTLASSQRGLSSREPVELAAAAEEVVRSRLADAERRGVSVRAELGTGPLLGDTRLAERLAANLIDNALRHNAPGGWVQVWTGRRAGHAVLSVVNTGPVVPPAEVGRLFEPFQRLDAGRTGGRDGLGLGLSIVRAIADAHNARLHVCARPGGGLDILVRFPRCPAAGPSTAPAPALAPGQPRHPERPVTAAGLPVGL